MTIWELWEYLCSNGLNEELQSAYKANHSCETALIRVQDDILKAIDSHRGVLLLLLDLSAAFDTVDHEILLGRLSSRFGIKGKALDWLRSYLTDRTQLVKVDDASSTVRPLHWGVPQGSVLGPMLYLLYTSPLGDIVREHSLSFHFYADDSQLYPFGAQCPIYRTAELSAVILSSSLSQSRYESPNDYLSKNTQGVAILVRLPLFSSIFSIFGGLLTRRDLKFTWRHE